MRPLFALFACSAVCSAPVFASTSLVKKDVPKTMSLQLVRNARANAVLVIDSRRYPLQQDLKDPWSILERPIAAIAAAVGEYVGKSTGAKLPVLDLAARQQVKATAAGPVEIYIGRGEYVDRAIGQDLDKLDPSGYLIRAVDSKHLIIAGPTSEGTEFGTYEFLERFAGIRWLLPTEVGDYIPKRKNLVVPADTKIQDEPAFIQVPLLASVPSQQLWARHMRFWTRINFHHNLNNLFPPAQYTGTHPEFFPVLKAGDTKRYLPAEKAYDWQPCFSAPGIVDEAAKNVIKYLDANPRVRSYSFGINDATNFCQCEVCRKQYIAGENFLGLPSYSETYYKFVNDVIEKVVKVHPDVWFGCLAYNNVGSPPVHFRLHPRLIPFLTYDTMHLLDPQRRKSHETLMKAWGDKCTFLGRYDYTYGADHVPPRIYLHHWADYVRWSRNHKVKAWYAETYPFFGEAPKYYAMSKIWWNPDRDVDALLDEWYRLAFGKAAPPMKAYFDHWENYWTKRVPKTGYFEQVQNDQFILGSLGWLEDLRASDVEKGDSWIGQAQKLADTPETKARVAVMAKSWEYYRTVMQTYLRQEEASRNRSIEAALPLLQSQYMVPDLSVKNLHEKLMQDPILTFTWQSSYPFKDSARAPFLDALETYFDTRDERLTSKLDTLSQDTNTEMAALAATSLAITSGKAQNLMPNSGFEAENPLQGWWAGMHQGTGTVNVTNLQPYEGAHAVEVKGTADGYGGVFREDVPVKPGKRYLLILRARWEGTPNSGTVSRMLLYFNDAKGAMLPGSLIGNTFRCSAGWRAFVLESPAAPEGAVTLTARAEAAGQPAGHKAYFDDLKVYEIGVTGR